MTWKLCYEDRKLTRPVNVSTSLIEEIAFSGEPGLMLVFLTSGEVYYLVTYGE